MAIGNLFLGTARKTIGDIVMYRRNGEQLARVRVRKIANPRTEAQALQRNYMAPVSKFYAPLADVLERSWEDCDRQKSLGQFLKVNAGLARSSGWYVVKGAGFTPLPYKVSQGTLQALTYNTDELNLPTGGVDDIQVKTISAALVNMGYQYGDQLTTILCLQDDAGDVRPVWSRVLLSSSDESDIFSNIAGSVSFTPSENGLAYSGVAETIIAAVFIISRYNGTKWLRSSQYVSVDEEFLANFTSIDARAAAIASYQNGDSVVSSDIYLNGGAGSKAQEQQLVVKLVSTADWSYTGLAIPMSVFSDVNNEATIITMRNAANGEIVRANIIRQSNRFTLVRRSNAHQFIRRSNVQPYAAEYVDKDASRAFYQWMQRNGITPNV